MQTTTEKSTAALNDLIVINNDRYEGYQKAMGLINDADLKTLFSELSFQSKSFNTELRDLLPFTDDMPKRDETRLSGKFYRAWMDIKNTLSSNDRKMVLESCEKGEDVAKKAYESVLANREELPTENVEIIQRQYDEILESHIQIKKLRDSTT